MQTLPPAGSEGKGGNPGGKRVSPAQLRALLAEAIRQAANENLNRIHAIMMGVMDATRDTSHTAVLRLVSALTPGQVRRLAVVLCARRWPGAPQGRYLAAGVNMLKPGEAPFVSGEPNADPEYVDFALWQIDGWQVRLNLVGPEGGPLEFSWDAPDDRVWQIVEGERMYRDPVPVDQDITDESYRQGWPGA